MNRMRLIAIFLAISVNCFSQTNLMQQASDLEIAGKFREASALLEKSMTDPANGKIAQQKQIEFELDRLQRIKKDFPYTRAQLYKELQDSVKDLAAAELDKWISEGRFDSREIDGEQRFMTSSVSNLYFRYPELEPRRIPAKAPVAFEQAVYKNCMNIQTEAQKEKQPYVLPKRFRVSMTVTAKPEAAPDGEVIRAWLPIPRQYPFQTEFDFISASGKVRHMDGENSPIRSILLEQVARNGKPTVFKLGYEYTTWGVRFEADPPNARSCDPADPVLRRFLTEAPHVVFTPEIRALAAQIAGDEQNPYLKAKKFYDWIASQIKYSYAIEYSTIRNISDYCRTKEYGDCGQEALLFITLCRLNGIPARWQSGWNTVPGGKTIHDWSEIYIAPWGWIPVDPYMGIFAMRYVRTLTAEQKLQLRDFYFGGLDQFRMAANSDHNQELVPAKASMRSDNVDFQRGELEWGGHNIYFDQYSWELNWKEIPLQKDHRSVWQ
jgi:transglutaminase-like putative cysteine protease